MPRRAHNTGLLDGAYAGPRATIARAAAAAHLDKHQRALGIAHDEVNLATAAPGRPIIALHQTQAGGLQTAQCLVFTGLAQLPGGGRRRARCARIFKETH